MISKETGARLLATTAVFSLIASAPPASAQSTVDARYALEEIIVTARKRAENIQDIPESISAFTSTDIENAGITRVSDVIANVPNIILQPSYRQGVVNISARGLSTPQQGDSPVVLNIDGVQAPAQDFINQDLFDIERIEVLKGPQGALYGAGAIAGAINIVTRQPSNDFEGFVKARYGRNEAQRYVTGLSGPIVEDRLMFRISGVHENRDGYIRNSLTNDLVDFVEESSVRGSLLAQFDAVRFDLRASYMDGKNGASYYESFPLLPDPVPEIDLLFDGPLGRLGSDISNAQYVNHSNVQTEEKRDVLTTSLKIEVDAAGGVITSITGYNRSEQENWGDLDFQPADILLQDVRFDAEVFNTELRYASDASKRFRWVTGAFYQERDIYNQVIVWLGDFTVGHKTIEESRNNPANAVLTDGRDTIDSQAWAIYLSTNYDITDALTATVAARYDKVEVGTAYVGENSAFLVLPNQTAARSFDEIQPRFNLSFEVNEHVMAYANLARGFRTGVPNPTAAFASGLPRFIEPEIADTVETGMKTNLLDNRITLNGAVFYSDIKNRHHYFYGAALQSMTTYDKAEVYGLEMDLVALLTSDLRLQAGFGLMDATIKSDEVTRYLDFTSGDVALVVNNKGSRLPDVPRQSLNLVLEYDTPITGSINLFARGAYRYLGKIYFDTENFIHDGGPNSFFDARLGLRTEYWSITGFVDNISDERTYSNYAYSGGAGNYLPNRPRVWGIEAGIRF